MEMSQTGFFCRFDLLSVPSQRRIPLEDSSPSKNPPPRACPRKQCVIDLPGMEGEEAILTRTGFQALRTATNALQD